MANNGWFYAPLLALMATTAHAADGRLQLRSEHTNYSASYGKLLETSILSNTSFGSTAINVGATYGKRDFATGSASAVRLSGNLYHDWNERLSTRSTIAASNHRPVFATRELGQDVSFKPVAKAMLTVGGKYSRYVDDRTALSWSLGGSYYFKRGFASYRFTAFDVSRLGHSTGHLGSVRINDARGDGSTQLWLGAGTSLQDQLRLPVASEGKYRSLSLQRIQPLNRALALTFGVGRTWYQTNASYHATSFSFGLTMNQPSRLLRF